MVAIADISRMMALTCSIARAASAAADWIEPICSAISSVAFAVCPASDFTSEATTAKPLPDAPARAASMVALSASRLVCPAIAWISPTTSPMRVAALPSSDMVVTVRWASDTARPATSVDFAACEAISPIEAANSSTEPAAVVTLSDAAATRCSAVRASADMVSAALLRSLELISSFLDAPRSLLSALSTECLNCRDGERNRFVALGLRAARIGLDGGEPFPLDHVVAEHDHRACHLANLIACVSGGNAGAGVAGGELLHHAGQAMKRLRDAASDQPAETKAERDHGDADHDYPGARMGLRCGQPR